MFTNNMNDNQTKLSDYIDEYVTYPITITLMLTILRNILTITYENYEIKQSIDQPSITY